MSVSSWGVSWGVSWGTSWEIGETVAVVYPKRTLAPSLRGLLLSLTTVTDLTSTRIYFARLPQQPTRPAITLELTDRDPHNALASIPSLTWSQARVTCWADSYAAATALAHAVQRGLNGKKFYIGGHTYIRSIVAAGMQDDYRAEVDAYAIQQDYRIWHYYQPTVTSLTAEDLTAEAFLSPTSLAQTHLLTTEDVTAEAFLEAGLVVTFWHEATFTTAHGNGAMLPQPEDAIEVATTTVLDDTAMLPQPEDAIGFTLSVHDDGAP